GTRDVTALAGLRHAMPWTAAAAMLAAVSMAGVPPLLGFVAKEGLYATVAGFDRIPYAAGALLVAAVAASAMLGAAALTAGVSPFLGRTPRPADAHEAPVALWL